MKYTASQIKQWNTDTEINGKWIPARPITIYKLIYRIKLAWHVLTSKYDALDWED